MNQIAIITPAGSDSRQLLDTAESIYNLSNTAPKLNIKWVIVTNNGFSIQADKIMVGPNTEIDIYDINPISSRSAARNFALNVISETPEHYVIFIDAGDLISLNIERIILDINEEYDMITCRSAIADNYGNLTTRGNIPMFLKHIINPFFLGGVIIKRHAIRNIKFHEGRREDWKFWLEILATKPRLAKTKHISYTYTIKSISDHIRRRLSHIHDQYLFFHRYLNKSILLSLISLAMHYLLLVSIWALRKLRILLK
jgi:hypothetical protein